MSGDATLHTLRLASVDIGPFTSDVRAYTATVDQKVASVEVTAIPTETDAQVKIKDANGWSSRGQRTVRLAEGDTTITVTVTAADQGANTTYTVTVTRVVGSPVSPINVAVLPRATGQLHVQWDEPPGIGDGDVVSYTVQWKPGSEPWEAAGTSSQATVTEKHHDITGLDPSVLYDVRVIATNIAGDSPPSSVVSATPRDNVPPPLIGASLIGRTLTLTYDEPLRREGRHSTDSYTATTAGGPVNIESVAVEGNAVVLRIARWIAVDSVVTVSYQSPTETAAPQAGEKAKDSGPDGIEDMQGNTAASFSRQLDENLRPPPAWSAQMTVGHETGYIPHASGHVPWTGTGTLTNDEFTVDGTTYRIQIIINLADGVYLWVSGEIPRDFIFRIEENEFLRVESSIFESAFGGAYWWPKDDFNWLDGETVDVSIILDTTPKEDIPQRDHAPPIARFRYVPDDHNGVDNFTFRTYFTESVSIDAATLRDHGFVVTGGSVVAAEALSRSNNRIWEITVAPTSTDDVAVALPAGQVCETEGAICTADGRRLSNRPYVFIYGPPGPYTAPTSAPAIRGTVKVGEVLTADASSIADENGLSQAEYRYQWIAAGTDISEATGPTYVPTRDVSGKTLQVRVNFTDDDRYAETLTSTATEAVPEPTDQPHRLNATATEGGIVLTWQEPDNHSGLDYRILRHRPELGEPESLVHVVFTFSSAPTFTDTEVEPGVLYVYRVKSVVNYSGDLSEASWPAMVRMPGA